MSNVDVRLVSSTEEFKALAPEWTELYNQTDRCTIFSSWEWMFTWWEVFSKNQTRELFIICLYEDEKLVGIAPFHIEKSYPISFLQGKTLRFLGASAKNEIMTEFPDFIVKKEAENEFVSVISDYLMNNQHLWDFADFEFLQEGSLALGCFSECQDKVFRHRVQYGVRYIIPKVTSLDEYQSIIPKRWSKSFKKKSRAIERDGGSVTEGIETVENIKPMFKQLGDMHRERWQGKLKNCVFDAPEFKEFHLKVLERLVPQKKANIQTLKLNDEALSSIYTFEDKGQIHCYQCGFYSKYANKYSPLFLLICNQIGLASENNKRFDFMFDDNLESYKKHQYQSEGKKMYRLRLTHQPYRLFMHHYLKKTVAGLRETKAYFGNKLSSQA